MAGSERRAGLHAHDRAPGLLTTCCQEQRDCPPGTPGLASALRSVCNLPQTLADSHGAKMAQVEISETSKEPSKWRLHGARPGHPAELDLHNPPTPRMTRPAATP